MLFIAVLNDQDVLEYLDNSEYEDNNDGDYVDDGTDDEFLPDNRMDSETTSNSSSELSSADDSPSQDSQREGQGHGRISTGRGRISRGRSSRGRSSRGRGSRGSSRGRSNRGISSRDRGRNVPIEDEIDISLNNNREWQAKSFAPSIGPLSEPSYAPIDTTNFTKEQYFQEYIDDEIINLMVEKTNQMYIYKTGKSLHLTYVECKTFLGITMMMSCLNYPYIRMYWETRWRIALISDAMTRDRYFQLRTTLKVVFDPDITHEEKKRDRLWKVRPIITRILQGCHKQVKEQHISIDEMIIPFSGSCGIKQYCPNKPNPVGLKAFVLANPNGIVCDFTVYQGDTTYPEDRAAGFGLGESAVLNLTRTLVPGHVLYFDRYFTSVKLAEELIRRGFQCAGTIMKNRIPNALKTELPDDREMKSQGRGSSVVFVNSSDTVAVTKWYDNKPVTLLSTVYGIDPEDECRRWCKRDKEYQNIRRPIVVKNYNNNMGGVDLADRMLAVCPSRARTNKWTIRFVSHMLDLSASNAWILFRKTELEKGVSLKKIASLRQWKMEIAENMIDNYLREEEMTLDENSMYEEESRKKRGRPAVVPLPSQLRRLNGPHLPIFVGVSNRCRQPGCNKRTTAKCSSCDMALCLTSNRNCYMLFHQ